MISIIDKVGKYRRGPKRSLSYDEAYQAAELIVNGKASPVQIGAFLMAERIKSESVDEISAFVEVLQKNSYKQKFPQSIDCTGSVIGRRNSFMATFPTAFVLAACGLPVTLHGSPSFQYHNALTIIDLLHSLGIAIHQPSISNNLIQAGLETGIMIIPTEEWCPSLKKLRPLREEFGLYTILNIAEQFMRPTSSPYMAAGVNKDTDIDKAALLLQRIGVEKGIIVQGTDGSEDILINERTRTIVLRGGFHELFIVDPEVYRLGAEVPEADWTTAAQLAASHAVLRNSAPPALKNTVVLNAAVRLWATDMVDSIEDGVDVAMVSLEQGAARRKYESWLRTAGKKIEDVG